MVDSPRPAPPAPEGLSVSESRRWAELWTTAVSGAWRPEHYDGLVRLVQLYTLRDIAYARYLDNPESTGSMGQRAVSPWAKELDNIEKRITVLENTYGLNPLAWNRLGVEVVAHREAATGSAEPEEPDDDDPRLDVD